MGRVTCSWQHFLNVEVKWSDRDCSRCLWVNNVDSDQVDPVVCRFCQVVFRVNCSPFLLNATLQHLLKSTQSLHITWKGVSMWMISWQVTRPPKLAAKCMNWGRKYNNVNCTMAPNCMIRLRVLMKVKEKEQKMKGCHGIVTKIWLFLSCLHSQKKAKGLAVTKSILKIAAGMYDPLRTVQYSSECRSCSNVSCAQGGQEWWWGAWNRVFKKVQVHPKVKISFLESMEKGISHRLKRASS